MDPIEFSERFFDDDLIAVGDRMLRDIRQPDFHRRWATHEYLLQWHEGRQSRDLCWPPVPERQPGELRPLYLGISSPGRVRAEVREQVDGRPGSPEPHFTISKSLGGLPVWNEQGSLAEAKALLLYAHRIVVFDPIDDFIDQFVVDGLRVSGIPRSDSASGSHIVEESLAIREGIRRGRITEADRNRLKLCIVRLIYFLGRFKPFIRSGLVCITPRPRLASLGIVRRDLSDMLGRRDMRLEALPRQQVRALLLARALEATDGIDAYSPSSKELDLMQAYLGDRTSVREQERLTQIVSARLPNLSKLTIFDLADIRHDGDFAAWRKLLREVLRDFAAGEDSLAIEALDASAADLRNRWREQVTLQTFALVISAALSAPMGTGAVVAGLAGATGGLAAAASAGHRRRRAMRHHVISLSSMGAPLIT